MEANTDADYENVTIEDDKLTLPISSTIIKEVSERNDVDVSTLKDAIATQQYDILDDGTRIGFIGYLLENEEGNVLSYGDDSVCLTVDYDVWMKEREWFEYSDKVIYSLMECHTKEVNRESEKRNENNEDWINEGYVVSVDFPIKSVDEHEEIAIDPYPIAERSEFLRFETGFDKKKAQVQAMTEAVSIHSMDKEKELEVISDICSISIDEVLSIQDEIQEWKDNATDILQDFAKVDKDESAFATTNVFERMASMR